MRLVSNIAKGSNLSTSGFYLMPLDPASPGKCRKFRHRLHRIDAMPAPGIQEPFHVCVVISPLLSSGLYSSTKSRNFRYTKMMISTTVKQSFIHDCREVFAVISGKGEKCVPPDDFPREYHPQKPKPPYSSTEGTRTVTGR